MLTICIVPFIVVFPNLSNMASCGAIWVPQMSERYQASGTSQVWGSFILGALTRWRLQEVERGFSRLGEVASICIVPFVWKIP